MHCHANPIISISRAVKGAASELPASFFLIAAQALVAERGLVMPVRLASLS